MSTEPETQRISLKSDDSTKESVDYPIGITPSQKTAFERLPDEIIEQILQLTNANAFASLILLNRKWRTVSQQAHLYAHHLAHCPSYLAAHSTIPIPEDEESLPQLRKLFAHEVKRNLFESWLRPQETVINLVSTSISSSSAPGGEAFHFSISPKGRYVLAYSSSRIHVLDVGVPEVKVIRELKILRRPASTTITDDGSLLAVLSTDLQVDLYDLTGGHPKHTKAVVLDHTPRTIALSPTGAVLACAYDSGVEVSSLDPGCISNDRRAVKCYAVDSLSFSSDGTQLLGTTLQSRNPSTVVLTTAPYYDPGSLAPEESASALWTTSILFPNSTRDNSHATLLPGPLDDEAKWTFTYDRVFETFRAVRIDDLRNGTTYFTGPTAEQGSIFRLLPSTLPAASSSGDFVAAGFRGCIWLYGIPEDLEAAPIVSNTTNNRESEPSTPSSLPTRRNSAPSLRSITRPRDPGMARTPQWQLLGDRLRNTFVEGRRITTLEGVRALNWVHRSSTSFHGERLVVVAPGVGGQPPISEDDGMNPVDGGRLSILDFDNTTSDGKRRFVTIEVGLNEPETLEEEHRDLDTEVALVRRRTVAQRRESRYSVARGSTAIGHSELPPPMPVQDTNIPFGLPALASTRSSDLASPTDAAETASIDEDHEVFDDPYSHTNPRSGTTLRRAATAAAVNRRLHPRSVAQEHIVYRRADGREEHPHESDADNWEPPPPPYQKEPVPPLPEHIQRSILADHARSLQRASTQRVPNLDFPGLDSPPIPPLQRTRSSFVPTSDSRRESRFPFNRSASDSTVVTATSPVEETLSRPVTSPASRDGFDDLYDVSPVGTPQPTPRPTPRAAATTHQIPRRPVGSSTNTETGSDFIPRLAMRATLQQPVSPIPQPMNETLNRRLLDWENTQTETDADQASQVTRESEPSPVTPPREVQTVQEPVPLPSSERPVVEDPPSPSTPRKARPHTVYAQTNFSLPRSETVPILPTAVKRDIPEIPAPIWRHATVPVIPKVPENLPSPVAMPSPDQLARLNNRSGRPAGLSDPSRRMSGASIHSRMVSGQSTGTSGSRPVPHSPASYDQYLRSPPPRAAVGAHGSRPTSGMDLPQQANNLPPPRRVSLASQRHSSVSSNLRPPVHRLETINSVTSAGESSPFLSPQRGAAGVSRQPSRAERSAAKNIKDAKKKGWRASMRNGRQKAVDAASSAEWTDVSRDTSREERKSGRKCSVM